MNTLTLRVFTFELIPGYVFTLETSVDPNDAGRMIVESFVREPGFPERRLLGRYTTRRKDLSEKEAIDIVQTEWNFDL